MNATGWSLRRRDLTVLILCAALLACGLGAAGRSGRQRAKELVCQANLRQWGRFFQDYVEQTNGPFLTGCTDGGYWWPLQVPHEFQDWKRNRAWFCPMATKPTADEHGALSPTLSIYSAWGIFAVPSSMTYQGQTYSMNPNGISGSFGLNGYLLYIRESSQFEGGVPASDGWRNLSAVPVPGNVPMLLDALRFDLWPKPHDGPPADEFAAWSSNQMGRCCINRHDGAVNGLFVDGSARKVGLKELWTLKWYKRFNTEGPWTRAGGVIASDWPEWIRPFKDY